MTWVDSLPVCDWWPVLCGQCLFKSHQAKAHNQTGTQTGTTRIYEELQGGQLHSLCNGWENHNWVWSLRLILKWLALSKWCGIAASLPEWEVHAPEMGDKTCNHIKAILEVSSLRGNSTVSVVLHVEWCDILPWWVRSLMSMGYAP